MQAAFVHFPTNARRREVNLKAANIFLPLDRKFFVAPTHRSAPGRNQKATISVFLNFVNAVRKQSVSSRKSLKFAFSVTHQTAFLGGNPQRIVGFGKEFDETIARKIFMIAFIKNRETHAVKTHQTVKCREPNITVRRLRNRINRILRQPVVRRPRIETILRRRADYTKENRRES